MKRLFPKIGSDERGVALLVVMAAITFLSTLLADFTFETKINKLKVYNEQDKYQARLNAQAGLNLALSRIEIYKEAKNLLDKNKDKVNVPADAINSIWSIPFMYPLPLSKRADIIQRSAAEKFSANSLIQGEIMVVVNNNSQLLNLNFLRVNPLLKPTPTPGVTPTPGGEPFKDMEKQLTKLLENAYENKKLNDEEFANRFANLDPAFLVKTLKFYISERNSYDEPEVAEISKLFSNNNVAPKYGPMSSLSELYVLPGWDDEIVELILKDVTVHGDMLLDLNKLTNSMLKLLFPSMTNEQIDEFMKYRDGNPQDKIAVPHPFIRVEDFKGYLVENAHFVTSQEFDDRMGEFKKAGVKFGTSGSLFQIVSTGSFGRAKAKLTAFVTMPTKPEPAPSPVPTTFGGPVAPPPAPGSTVDGPAPNSSPVPQQFLTPRVVEILMN